MSMKRIISVLLTLVGFILGYSLYKWLVNAAVIGENIWYLIGSMIVCGFLAFLTEPLFERLLLLLVRQTENNIKNISSGEIWAGAAGLIIGLVIANLITKPLESIEIYGAYISIFINLLFGYLGLVILVKKKDDIIAFLKSIAKPSKDGTSSLSGKDKRALAKTSNNKILDTSVIIDGRILDICKCEFIDGTLIVPSFVLNELQHIADSSDNLKRTRGRRGLDILNTLRKDDKIKIQIVDIDYEDIEEVDSKLLKFAKSTGYKIMTNDLNLNKVAALREVTVLNINDLANALKPVVLPGEDMVVQVMKDGKESGQGLAYLDDGTMVVIEDAKRYIGQVLKVEVTTVLQTSAGKMIFAKIKNLEKAI